MSRAHVAPMGSHTTAGVVTTRLCLSQGRKPGVFHGIVDNLLAVLHGIVAVGMKRSWLSRWSAESRAAVLRLLGR